MKTYDEAIAFARFHWTSSYVYWVNIKGWQKQPDWTPGQPIVREAIPVRGHTFQAGHYADDTVENLLRNAKHGLQRLADGHTPTPTTDL